MGLTFTHKEIDLINKWIEKGSKVSETLVVALPEEEQAVRQKLFSALDILQEGKIFLEKEQCPKCGNEEFDRGAGAGILLYRNDRCPKCKTNFRCEFNKHVNKWEYVIYKPGQMMPDTGSATIGAGTCAGCGKTRGSTSILGGVACECGHVPADIRKSCFAKPKTDKAVCGECGTEWCVNLDGERPFRCPNCGFHYTRYEELDDWQKKLKSGKYGTVFNCGYPAGRRKEDSKK